MKIVIISDNQKVVGLLEDNPTSRDFFDLLPLEVKLEDYAGNEKIFYPPGKLSIKNSPPGHQPAKGDISYFAPWGDVALFYEDFSFSKGLIRMGKVIESLDDLKHLREGKVKIEKGE